MSVFFLYIYIYWTKTREADVTTSTRFYAVIQTSWYLMEIVLLEGRSRFNSRSMWLNVSYCSADDYGAYLLWITTIVMMDVYENKGN